jgi:hypothetical protein
MPDVSPQRLTMNDESKVRDVAETVAGIVKAVPVYQDVAQPAAQELGKALQTIAQSVHIALAPISALVWGYDQIRDFVSTKVAERLARVRPEDIVTPKPHVAGPALEALRFTGHEPSLADLYANLLASAMDKNTAEGAHPAFVEIIRQLTADEAKLVGLFAIDMAFPLLTVRWEFRRPTTGKLGGRDVLVHFSLLGHDAEVAFPHMTPTYIDNLCRLGLAEVPLGFTYTSLGLYEPLEAAPEVQAAKAAIEKDPERVCRFDRQGLRITELGKQFARICVRRKG